MDRGFNAVFQGGNNRGFGGQQNVPDYRERANQSDRRYDDFYGPNHPQNNMNNMNRFNNNPGGQMQNHPGGNNWNNGANQMQAGFNQQQGGMNNGPNAMLSALQQQNIINALMSTQVGKNLHGSQNQNQNRRFNHNQMGNNRNRRGGANNVGARPGDKRKQNNQGGSFNNNKQSRRQHQNLTKKKEVAKDPPKKVVEEKEEEEEIDIPDNVVVVPEALMESVEKLRNREEIKRNVADEDVDKLKVFCFTGKQYQCKTCGLLLRKDSVFAGHLMNKNHVMKVIDARTAKTYQDVRDILDIDLTPDDWFEKSSVARAIIIKQSKVHMKAERDAKAKAEADYNKTPSNFFNFNMELRKSVVKSEDEVVITSLVESNVRVKKFTEDKFFGCEFVRAVTGFHCRLCSINIREAKGVIPHIESKLHKTNYSIYVTKNPVYEKTQKEQNQDLFDIMSQHDGKSIVLAESANVEGSQFLSLLDSELVRIESVMNPQLKEKEKEEAAKSSDDKNDEEKPAEEGKGETTDEEKKSDEADEEVTEEGTEEEGEPSQEAEQEDEPAEEADEATKEADVEGMEEEDNAEANEDEAEEAAVEESEPAPVETKTKKGRGRSKTSKETADEG